MIMMSSSSHGRRTCIEVVPAQFAFDTGELPLQVMVMVNAAAVHDQKSSIFVKR